MNRSARAVVERRVYGGVSHDQRRSERRTRLVRAGIACFGRDGYVNTTTRSIAAESGLTQRYFYESFESIDHFFAQVVRELGEELQQSIDAAVRSAPANFEERLRAALTAYLSSIHGKRHVGRILVIEAFSVAPTTSQVRRFLANVADLMRSIIAADLAKPVDRSVDLDLLCTGYVGAIHHIALRWVLGGFAESLEQIVDTATGLIVGSLRGQGLIGAEPAKSARRRNRD